MSAVDPEAMDLEATSSTLPPDDSIAASRAELPSAEDDVLVPAGGAFEGQVAITGPTRIEGSVRGSLRGVGDLIVGEKGRIEGRVECESLECAGEIVGPVAVRTRARLAPGARLDGDLRAPIVAFDESAIWNGRALVGDAPADEAGEDSSASSS